MSDLKSFPGGDIVEKGLQDLSCATLSMEALVVLVASPRLRGLGFEVPQIEMDQPYEHALYARIQEQDPKGAHAAYNALLARLVSFANSFHHR